MPSTKRIRVLLVDDHAVVRGGLVYVLSTLPDIEIIGEADDGEQAVALCAHVQPDVVLMDLVMPHMDGIEATRRIRAHFPAIQVVILTGFQEKELVKRALQAGAVSYLLKGISYHELVTAIRAAHVGKPTLAPEVVPFLIQSATQPAPTVLDDLSPREQEVLAYLTDGLTNLEIASRMVVSVNTIRHHVRSILEKFGVTNRTAAARCALHHHFVQQQANTVTLRHWG